MLQSTRPNEVRDHRNVTTSSAVPQSARLVRVGLPRNPASGPGPPLKSFAVSDERRRSRDRIIKSPPERPSAIPRSMTGPNNVRSAATTSSSRLQPTSTPLRPAFQTSPVESREDEVRGRNHYRYNEEITVEPNDPDPFIFFPQEDRSQSPVSSIKDHDSGLGIALPSNIHSDLSSMLPPQLIPELQALAFSVTKTPISTSRSFGPFSSPSSVYSDSPGPWSVASAGTPATSLSSVSPGLVRPTTNAGGNKWTKSVTPTPSVKSKLPRLPALQEAPPVPSLVRVTSRPVVRGRSKSDSTSRVSLSDSLGPTPPPRSSSVKRTRVRQASREEDDRNVKTAVQRPLSKIKSNTTLTSKVIEKDVVSAKNSSTSLAVSRAHADLQQSIHTAPPRPSREGLRDLGPTRPLPPEPRLKATNNRQQRLSGSGIGAAHPSPINNISRPGMAAERKQHIGTAPIDLPPRSPNRLGRFAKLGLFGRQPPTAIPEPDKSQRRLQRKGPTAGTGYETYGKHPPRGRKTVAEIGKMSSESDRSKISARKPSVAATRQFSSSASRANRSSQSDLDEFVSARMNPVWMTGGSGGAGFRSSYSALPNDETTLEEGEVPFMMLQDGPSTFDLEMSGALGLSEQDAAYRNIEDVDSSLIDRRSRRFTQDDVVDRIPSPTQVEGFTTRPRAGSVDTMGSSVVAPSRVSSSVAEDIPRFDVSIMRSPEKKSRKINWNIFRRKKKMPGPSRSEEHGEINQAGMAVSVTGVQLPKPMPYYVVMESEVEVHNPEMMGDLLAQAIGSGSDHSEDEELNEERSTEEIQIYRQPRAESILLPPAPSYPLPKPPVALDATSTAAVPQQIAAEEPAKVQPPLRRPRLAQVGRIPQVTPRGLQNNTEKRPSISRHFQNLLPAARQINRRSGIPVMSKKPSLEIRTNVSRSKNPTTDDSAKAASAPAEVLRDAQPFSMAFFNQPVGWPSNHLSEVSISSSSDGVRSILAPSLMPSEYEIPIMYRPSMKSVDILHEEDEVWNEYDELIDHVMSPSRQLNTDSIRNARAISRANGRGRIDSSTIRESRLLGRFGSGALPPTRSLRRERAKLVIETSLPRSLAPPVVFPSTQTVRDQRISDDIKLRRSRIVSALHSSYDPTSPFSMRDFLNEYGPYWRDSHRKSGRHSISTIGRSSFGTTTSGILPTTLPLLPASPGHQQDNAALVDVVERSKDPIALSELHFTSLMVARWLSFGRVLFSPAHSELHALPDRHVLVIDGLGNEDWAIYCAVTYEAQKALVYDLKEKSIRGTPRRTSQHSPPNLRRSEVTSLTDRFPFPPSFFSAVVLRFPPAMSEAKLKNILSESKKILAPGGYIELMLLDIDIVNMGVQTRRAVRELKIKMHATDPDISLRPIIDNSQTLLGQEGFTNLSRCVVGVPVHGPVTNSGDSSSRSSKGSDRIHKQTSREGDPTVQQASTKIPPRDHAENFSLNDLITDHSKQADAQISNMVSLTARGWWQRCFEAAVISDGDLSHSIFANTKVVQECKSRGSSFKLLIAHAQRPIYDLRRRTMSEPTVPTLATTSSERLRGTIRG